MSKFSEYIKTEVKKENVAKTSSTNINENNIEEMLEKYSKLTHDELLKEFMKESAALKNRGGLQEEQINEIEKVLKPHLNEQQKSMFDNLMTEIK